MEEKNEKVLSKKELKQRANEIKLEEKQRKIEEKAAIKAEKERRKNSFGRKVRNFFLTIIFVIILLIAGFYFGGKFLTQKQAELTDEKMSQIYQMAQESINDKDYKKAIELLKSIDESYSKYSDVEKKLNEAEQLYLNEYLVKADEYLKAEKFDKALKVFDDIEDEFKDSEVISDKKAEIKVAKLKAEVEELADEKTNLEMLEYLSEYDTESIEKLEDAVSELTKKYKDSFVLEARELLTTDYAKAKTNIEAAAKILPDDKDIKALVQELSSAEPKTVSLLTLKNSVTKGKIEISDGTKTVKSLDGTEYKNYILNTTSENSKVKPTVEITLDGEYSKLTGMVCIQNAEDATADVTFYDENDKVLKSIEELPGEFSIDVSNVKTLKIVFGGDEQKSVFIAEPTLTKASD